MCLPVADIPVRVNRTLMLATDSAFDLVITALTNSDDSLPINLLLANSTTNTTQQINESNINVIVGLKVNT